MPRRGESRWRDFCWNAVGAYAVEPTASCLLSTAYKSAETCRERPQAIGDSWRRPRGRRDWRGGYAAGDETQADLRPAASGKAQPQETPLEVEVVQL